jgi:hypothetical protein
VRASDRPSSNGEENVMLTARDERGRWWATTLTASACGLVAIGAAMAQSSDDTLTPLVQERLAFTAADTNGDNAISEAELARDAAAGFSGLDRDRSETLTPEELGPYEPALFGRVDRNGDGVLSFGEIIVHKVGGFEKADVDGDGQVSFDEMVDEAKSELGVM